MSHVGSNNYHHFNVVIANIFHKRLPLILSLRLVVCCSFLREAHSSHLESSL